MNLLLDTCTFLWIVLDPRKLSSKAASLFQDPNNNCYLSAVSAWEIAVQYALGRVHLSQPPHQFVPAQRQAHQIQPLALEEAAASRVHQLPHHHKDPFDRMLICQAMDLGLALLSPDQFFSQYAVPVIW